MQNTKIRWQKNVQAEAFDALGKPVEEVFVIEDEYTRFKAEIRVRKKYASAGLPVWPITRFFI